ncbi:hypothetical protein BDZ91DRAFT_104115 [Kalaharituber pfeilii]|nr:hypothetical protein BDZ91DRAFT_104115 [Kalaharituber pfeilii]
MFPNETARLFTGNISLYQFQTRYRQKIFLQRNIDRALKHNEDQIRRRNQAALSEATPQLTESPSPASAVERRTRPQPRIQDIANRLKTEIAVSGAAEPVLKIDLTTLRGKSEERRNSVEEYPEDSIRVAVPIPKRPKTIRCRCVLTIFGKAITPDTRSRAKGSDRNQLIRVSELCTIVMDPEDHSTATLKLDDPIYIKASKLFVLSYRGPIKSFCLADSYYSQISLQPVDPDQIWPPPLIKDIDEFIEAASCMGGDKPDPYTIQLIATFPNLPQVPKKGEALRMAVTAGSRQCENLRKRFELEVDCGWSNPFSAYTASPEPQPPQVNRLPTPLSDKDAAPSRGVPVNYHFRRNAQDVSPDAVPGVNGALSGYSKFTVKGYICPFCEGKEFSSCNRLHFHLITCHDLFEFQVKQKKSPRGTDAFADIWVDLSRKYSGVSEKTKDPRSFCWIRPKQPFILRQLLDGNWRWLNEKNQPLAPHQLQLQRERGMIAGEKRFNPEAVRELQPRKKRRFIVPKPLHKLRDYVFIRGKSKRFCHAGEELSESDEDADEDWLMMKHEETIDDFEDVGGNEQKFMKIFDRHLFKERPIGYVHLPETLVRFAREHREWLRATNMFVEFYKSCLNQIQYGMIDAEILQHCMQIVKGDEWNSTGKANVGLGLAGPLPLDDPQSPKGEQEAESRKDDAEESDDEDELTEGKSQKNQGEDADIKMEDAVDAQPEETSTRWGCPCLRPYKRTEVVYCDGHCGNNWFHMSCVQLQQRPPVWKCKKCQESS